MKDSPVRYTRSPFVVTVATLLLFSITKSHNFVSGELIIKFRNIAPDSIINRIIIKKDLSFFSGQKFQWIDKSNFHYYEAEEIHSFIRDADSIRWNLNDKRGRSVGSGIYIYYATQLGNNSGEIQTKKGKFAVLR